jgi:tetratricopeptide (TPR) repeat protein
LLALLTRLNALPGTFIYDDVLIVEQNTLVHQHAWTKIFSSPYWGEHAGRGLYRPLLIASFAANHWQHGLQPLGYHLVNLLLHAATTALLFLLLRALNPKQLLPSFLIALLFAVHPMTVESVNALVGRGELMVGVFAVLSLLIWLHYLTGALSKRWLMVLPLTYLLAMLSKENGVLILPMLVLVQMSMILSKRLPLRLTDLFAKWRSLAMLLTCLMPLLCLALRLAVLDHQTPTAVVLAIDSLAMHASTALQVIGKSVVSVVWPLNSQWDYAPYAMVPAASLHDPFALIGLLTVLVGCMTAMVRKSAIPLVLLAWLIVPIATHLQIVPIGIIFSERALYLVLIGLSVAAAMLIADANPIGKICKATLVSTAIVFAVLFIFRVLALNEHWRDPLSFWRFTQAAAPRSIAANLELGKVYRKEGELQWAQLYLRQAVMLSPHTSLAYHDWGVVLFELGDLESAKYALEKAMQINPAAVTANLLGILARRQEDFAAAATHFAQAIDLEKADADKYRMNLASLLTELNQLVAKPQVKQNTLLMRVVVLSRLKKTKELRAALSDLDERSTAWSASEYQAALQYLQRELSCSSAAGQQRAKGLLRDWFTFCNETKQ